MAHATPGVERRRVTLQTIADRLNVSRTTVSNAYGRPDQLNPALRARILATAAELGYPGPDPAAASLRRGRKRAVGLVFTEELSYAFTDPAAVLFLSGVAAACEEARSGLLLLPIGTGRAAASQAVVDGFVVYSMPDRSEIVDAALARRLPTVIVDEPRVPGVPFVGIDDRAGARAVAEHLVALGHRRFGVISSRLCPDDYDGPATPERQRAATYHLTRERLAGYADALWAAGVAWDTVPVYECALNAPARGRVAATALLAHEAAPTAILAVTDQLAVGALEVARERGIPVPGRLSVAGFDDSPAASARRFALTTVRQPLHHKGLVAGRLLVQTVVAGPAGAGADVVLPTELVVRASTGPAPN